MFKPGLISRLFDDYPRHVLEIVLNRRGFQALATLDEPSQTALNLLRRAVYRNPQDIAIVEST
jgi:hypothetical protein